MSKREIESTSAASRVELRGDGRRDDVRISESNQKAMAPKLASMLAKPFAVPFFFLQFILHISVEWIFFECWFYSTLICGKAHVMDTVKKNAKKKKNVIDEIWKMSKKRENRGGTSPGAPLAYVYILYASQCSLLFFSFKVRSDYYSCVCGSAVCMCVSEFSFLIAAKENNRK